jgi:GST-like protein
MIDLYYWTTPNGYKVLMALEELGLPYRLQPIDISRGEQFMPEFLAISPNNRIPAIVDHAYGPVVDLAARADDKADDVVGADFDVYLDNPQQSLAIFESGAILLHLAEKTGRLLPDNPHDRSTALQWLFWQVGGLGPMMGQLFHFKHKQDEKTPYAIERYRNETLRLLTVLNTRLDGRDYIAGEYSIADIATYPWVLVTEGLDIDLAEFPHVERWRNAIKGKPGTAAAYLVKASSENKAENEAEDTAENKSRESQAA